MGGMPGANERATGIIVIPARVASTRLREKLLLAQSGRPLLSYAVEQAKTTVELFPTMFREVYVAGDDERLCRIAERYGARSILSHAAHENGTSRIAAAVGLLNENENVDFVVNLQADHPQIAPEAIVRVANALLKNPSAEMSTAAVSIDATDTETLECRNVVKVLFNENMQATAFSRRPLCQSVDEYSARFPKAFRHVGIYAYRAKFLETFVTLPPSPGELQEDLEQLRALECRTDIRVVIISSEIAGPAIDTAEEYASFVRSVVPQACGRCSG